MKKVLGIATLCSVIALVTMIYLTYSGKAEVPSIYIQSCIFLLIATLGLLGSYSVQAFCPESKKMTKMVIYSLAAILVTAGALVAYGLIDFSSSVNWVISLGIIFMMLVQLQLLGAGSKGGSITKIASLLLILSNLFLAVFFITEMENPEMEIWIHAAVLCSLAAFLLGLIFVSRAKPSE
jgi:hypothetical protein